MKNIYSVESSKGVRLDISCANIGKPDLNQLLTARNLCYSAIESISETSRKEYPLAK